MKFNFHIGRDLCWFTSHNKDIPTVLFPGGIGAEWPLTHSFGFLEHKRVRALSSEMSYIA